MKRKQLPLGQYTGLRIGYTFLLVALLAGPILAPPSTAAAPPVTAIAMPTPVTTPAPIADATSAPAPVASVKAGAPDNAAMAAAIGPGGAEMGQRSARTVGATPSGPRDIGQALTTEALATEGTWRPTFGIQGLDVSGHQPSVNWQEQWNMGSRFAYVKATEGNYFKSDAFGSQYQGSRSVGMVRGAYHFAIPNWSSGADQARYFVQNGGGWSADGYTLPPVLDFEFNPYAGRTISGFYFGNTCYDMSPSQLTSWVRDFGNTVRSMTGRLPVIYTNTSWWKQCTADAPGFGDYPLWVAAYPSAPTNDAGALPSSWSDYSIWQYSSTGPFAGDSNVWNGSLANLKGFAAGYAVNLLGTIGAAWTAAGGGDGKLGHPTSNEICGLAGGGCYQSFQGGDIHYSPGTGARATWGGIRATWGALGYEKGKLGYPTTNEICGLANGGCYQSFQGGDIHYSPTIGARATSGPIRAAWGSLGYEKGKLGYPTTNEICGLANGGCYQEFQGGTIHHTAATGARATSGPLRAAWGSLGYEKGKLGYPTTNEICGLANGGCYQGFQGGTIHYSPATGAYATWGGIHATWGALGYEKGKLGYPITNEICGLTGGGCYQAFQGGTIHYAPGIGAYATWGGIRATWGTLGYENGKLGYPTQNARCDGSGSTCTQDFQGGTISHTSVKGSTVVFR